MASLEQVERLKEKMNCTYEEAREALEASGDDMLDAIIYLEKRGKSGASGGSYSTREEPNAQTGSAHKERPHDYHEHYESFGSVCGRFFRWVGKWIRRGNSNYLEVVHRGEVIISLPVTVLVLLLLFLFWVIIPLLVIGLFCGAHYRFRGRDFDDTKVNDYMDSASKAADNIKADVRTGFEKDR